MTGQRRRWRQSPGSGIVCAWLLVFSAGSWGQDSSTKPGAANTPAEDGAAVRGILDWRDTSADCPRTGASHCGGRYIDPLAGEDSNLDPADAEILATAAESETQGDTVRLRGRVEVVQAYRRLRAEEAEFNRASRQGSLHGNVELREPGLLMRGATGTVDTHSGEASLGAAQFVLHDLHVHGGSDFIKRRPDEIIELDDAWYSYCPPLQNQWVLRSKKLELDLETGTGTARGAKIEIGGAPVIYTPYLQFPLDERRKSGFLWPQVGSDSSGGADLALPYYFNLAPNYDATFTPRYISARGLLSELETRYLGEYSGYWELGGAWISGDDEYRRDYPDADGDRWLAAVEQRGLFRQRWRTEIDFTNISDDDYFRDLGTTSLQVTQSTHLAQRGEMSYLGDNWLTRVRVEEFKTIARDINTEPYRKLPQVTVVRTAAQQSFSPNLLLQSDYTYFDHETNATGHRLYNSLGVSYPMAWIWGFLKPLAKYRQLNYNLDEEIVVNGDPDDTPAVGAPLFSLDSGLFFERDTAWGLQTLEPRLYYLWADYEEQAGLPDFDTSELTFSYGQLFRESRFSGRDRLADANRLSVGITSRLLDPDSGRQRMAASIGQIYYFDDRLVNVGAPQDADFEGSSAIAAELELAPLEAIGLRSSWLWNTDQNQLDQSHIQLGFTGAGQHIFNLGYSYRRYYGNNPDYNDISQLDFSTYFPVNNEWAIFLRSLYDLEGGNRINDMAGIEYNSCCWRLRLVYQRHLDQRNGVNLAPGALVEHEHATYLEFQLKGLAGVGTRVGGMLEEFIRGYTDSDD